MQARYRAVAGVRCLDLGDEAVVFDPLSWDAHVLNEAAVAVLELLRQPCTVDRIAAFLGEALVESERDAAPAHARRLLDELVALRLVHEVDEKPVADR